MPVGLKKAPNVFQSLIQLVLAGVHLPSFVTPYVDNLFIFSVSLLEHLDHYSLKHCITDKLSTTYISRAILLHCLQGCCNLMLYQLVSGVLSSYTPVQYILQYINFMLEKDTFYQELGAVLSRDGRLHTSY